MDKVTVTTADRDKAADAYENQFALWGGDLARQVSDLTRSGGRDDTLLVQAFARHRIEATRQAEEQIKLLREAWAKRTGTVEVTGEAVPYLKIHFDNKEDMAAFDDTLRQALEATNG